MNEIFSSKTDFLFPSPSFLNGMGSIFNIAGNYFEYNTSETDLQADLRALKSDWYTIGKDFEIAKEIFRKKFDPDQLTLGF